MAEKKLKISLDLDDKAFSSAIKRMQQQLNSAFSGPAMLQQQRQISQKMASLGLGPLPGAPSDRQLEQSQQRAKQQSDRMFEETRRKFDIIKRLQTDLNKEQTSGVATEQRKLEIKEKLLDLTEKEKRATGELRAQVDRYNAQQAQRQKQAMGIVGGVGGTVVAGMGFAGAAIGAQGRLPIESASAAGQAATMLVGNQLKEMTQPSHQAFLAERMKATGAAQKAWQAGRSSDYLKTGAEVAAMVVGGSIAAIAAAPAIAALAGGAGVMAAIGAASGSGLAVGGALAGGSLTGILSNSKSLALATGQTDKYNQLSAKDLADLTQQSISAQEQADPLKKLAADYNEQNYQRNLGIQRGLGLSDQQFQGPRGFLRGNMNYGGRTQFTEEQVTQMQQDILGAGGSARMGRESGYGLQLQKDYNLTNASQILGSLSKTMGGAGETKEATARIMSTAFKDGLNDSELVDLFRSFTGTAAQFIAASGAKSAQDAARISEQFGKGLTENTGAGLEGAKSAYEMYKQLSGARSGAFSMLKRGAMMRDPVLSKLAGMGAEGSKIFEGLVGKQTLTADMPEVQEAAYRLHTTAEDVISRQSKAVGASSSMDSSMRGYNAIINKWEQANGITVGQAVAKGMDVPPEVLSAARMRGITVNTPGIGAAGGTLQTSQEIMAAGAQFGEKIAYPKTGIPYAGAAGGIGEEKAADLTTAGVASGQQAFIENWETFGKSLTPRAEDLAAVNKQLIILGQIAADIKAGKRPDSDFGKYAAALGTQPQANSSSALPGAGNSFSYK